MTLAEVTLALMVMVIFFSTFSLITKYFKTHLKVNKNYSEDNKVWVQKEQYILSALESWANVISQPSYNKEFIESLPCSYLPSGNDERLWQLPLRKFEGISKDYKFCLFSTSLGESNLYELVNEEINSRPGFYIFYAIPDKINPKSKPVRRLVCRPITFC